jgi:glycosyltransferase involved in cell wall biosynthesis
MKNQKEKPEISVVMSVFNNGTAVAGTIKSVLDQTFTDYEFIIVDDGSSDDTREIIETWTKKDKRIVFLENGINLGLTKSLNRGLREASGAWIARIDSGDLWNNGKLAAQKKFLTDNPKTVLLGTQGILTDDCNKIIGRTDLPADDRTIRKWFLNGRNPFLHSSVIFKSGFSYDDRFYNSQDFELWTRLFFEGKLANLEDCGVIYRVSFNSLSFKNRPNQIYYSFLIYKRFIGRLGGDCGDYFKNPGFSRRFAVIFVNIYCWGYKIGKKNALAGKVVSLSAFLFYPRLFWIKIAYCFNVNSAKLKFKNMDMAETAEGAIKVLAVIPGEENGAGMIFARRQVLFLKKIGIDVQPFYLTSRTNPAAIFSDFIKFRKKIKEFNPRIIHSYSGTATSFFAAFGGAKPLVITFIGSDLNPVPSMNRIRSSFGKFLSQMSALKAKKIICLSGGLRDRLWWKSQTAAVFPTGIDLEIFFPRPSGSARIKLGFSLDEKIILFNAGWSPEVKRLDIAQKAFALVKAEIPNCRLVVLKGDIAPDSVPIYMAAADVLLVASDFEGSPAIVQEAAACNLPVVSVDVGDVREVLKNVNPSKIVRKDASEIARAAIEIIKSQKRSNGFEAAKLISKENIAAKIIAIYKEMI